MTIRESLTSDTERLLTRAPRSHAQALPGVAPGGAAWGVVLAGSGAALLRLPFVHAPISSDEGGFLVVARSWHAGGGFLYGGHWVDRPPLLLGIYKVAAGLGGIVPLRLIGALAVWATVVLVGLTVRRLAGDRAATWASVVAGVLLASPLLGTVPVNGELLAAPFVAAGVWGAATALEAPVGRRLRWAALVAGGAAAAAVLVKQNMVDVGVFAVALVVVAAAQKRVGAGWIRSATAHAALGSAVVSGLVLGGAAMLGSTPGAIFYAMYPFRVHAATVMSYVPWSVRWTRIAHLSESFALSLAPLLLVALLVVLIRARVARPQRPAAIATLVLALYAVVSVLAGGSYWQHYLVELVVPVAIAAGLVVGSEVRWGRVVATSVVAVASVGWVAGLYATAEATGQVVGAAIGRAAAPGDTVVSLLGDGVVPEASGLSTPYPYLWSLPSRTLDPQLTTLADELEGSDAPAWIVVRGRATRQYVAARPAGDLLRRDYHQVTRVCGRAIYLRNGLDRSVPSAPTTCRLPFVSDSVLTATSGEPS